jgi:hypothetical protein
MGKADPHKTEESDGCTNSGPAARDIHRRHFGGGHRRVLQQLKWGHTGAIEEFTTMMREIAVRVQERNRKQPARWKDRRFLER